MLLSSVNLKMDIIQQILSVEDAEKLEGLRKALKDHINYLLVHDFNQLVQLLYRVDVDENRLRKFLQNSQEDAALIITELLIERQQQKIITKSKNGSQEKIPEDEKW